MAKQQEKNETTSFKSLDGIIRSLADILKPAEQLTVSQAAEKYRKLNNPGAFVGDWENWRVQPMVEPMDTYTSREYSGLIFVGPAQSAKTDTLVLNTLAYSIKVDPMDVMLVCPTNTDGRDFSVRRVDRLHRISPEIGGMLAPGASNDNVFDKHYRNGMLFTIAWPTASQLAGKPIGRVIFTDRDRMDDDIEGDGEPFDLGSKRTTTYGSYAMTVAESSPSRPVIDTKYIPRTLHEAPPCEGILKLYNRGDRRRWYWPCPHCNTYFEGNFKHLEWDNDFPGTNVDKSETVKMKCPHCQEKIEFNQRDEMQSWGIWLKDGQAIDKHGRVFGPTPRTAIASFWLNGVAAAFATWKKLIQIYLDANDEWERTGSEEALRKFYNTDLGEPYYPKSTQDGLRTPEQLQSRMDDQMLPQEVPANVRFLVATVDVQKRGFVVLVTGIMPGGKRFDTVPIDTFEITKSKRLDAQDDPLMVKPHAYAEDWDLITEQVLTKTYPLADGSGRQMSIRFTACDSGGKAGVTGMAYDYYRKLKKGGNASRFILVKGDPLPSAPRARIGYPDASKKDSKSAARGDVPVLFFNSNLMKDDLNGRLDCLEPGRGMYHFPGWLPDAFYVQLCAEFRGPKGWEKADGVANEMWDLSYYCIGLCISELLGLEMLDWLNPPKWAAEWDSNSMISLLDKPARFALSVESDYDFADFGKALA